MRTLQPLTIAWLTAGICFSAGADDGAITNKSMSQTIEPPDIVYGQAVVDTAVRETEHAFTDMMGFYVPAQAASGEVLVPITIDSAGSSTVMSGSGRGSSGSARVSPMVMSGSPATATMSPGPASSAGRKDRPITTSARTSSAGPPTPPSCCTRSPPPAPG